MSKESLKAGDHIYSWRTAYIYAHHGSFSSPFFTSFSFLFNYFCSYSLACPLSSSNENGIDDVISFRVSVNQSYLVKKTFFCGFCCCLDFKPIVICEAFLRFHFKQCNLDHNIKVLDKIIH